jgi:spoIIIJ-associated protein
MQKEDIKNLIQDLIEKVKVKISNINIVEDAGNTIFAVEVTEPHFFVSRDGEALAALNHLVNRIVENKTSPKQGLGGRSIILVDINDFQKKKMDNVRAVAHMMSERARYFKSNIEVDPMSSFERRVVHEFLADATDLKTESIGFGPSRRVVIKYIGNL